MPCDQRIQRRHRHLRRSGPALRFPARCTARGADERARSGRDRRVVGIDHQLDRARRTADGHRLDRDVGAAPVNELQHLHQVGCGSTATTRAPRRRNEAMRSPTWAPTSKHQIAAPHEAAVEAVHRRRARPGHSRCAATGRCRARSLALRASASYRLWTRQRRRHLDGRQCQFRERGRRRGFLGQAADADRGEDAEPRATR